MARYPHLQNRAQIEIDSVIGNERLPSIDDRAQLPYTNAVVKEVVRRFPPIPAGMALDPLARWSVHLDVYCSC